MPYRTLPSVPAIINTGGYISRQILFRYSMFPCPSLITKDFDLEMCRFKSVAMDFNSKSDFKFESVVLNLNQILLQSARFTANLVKIWIHQV